MKNLSEYENREIVAVGVYKDCEDVPFLAITLNDQKAGVKLWKT